MKKRKILRKDFLFECYYRIHHDVDVIIEDEEDKDISYCDCGAKVETIGSVFVVAKTELYAKMLASSAIDTSNREGEWDIYTFTLPSRGICHQLE